MVWGAGKACAMAGCLKPVSGQEALMDALASIDVAHTLTGARQGCPMGMQTGRCFEACYMSAIRGKLVNCPQSECSGCFRVSKEACLSPRLVTGFAEKKALLKRSKDPEITIRAPLLACRMQERRAPRQLCTSARAAAWSISPQTHATQILALKQLSGAPHSEN